MHGEAPDPGGPASCEPVDREGGFTLVEVVVSLLLLAIVSTAALGLFLRSMSSGDLQVQRQQAVGLANGALEQVRAMPVGSLVTGRSYAEVKALWDSPGTVDTSQSVLTLWDTAASASVDTVPTTQDQVVDNLTYTLRTFIDRCYQPATVGSCGATNVAGSHPMIRVAVGVTWTPGANRHCGTADGTCGYVVTTLIDPSSDPIFNLN